MLLIKSFQDPNADTEWNDVLRAKGILPPKEETELTEDDIVSMVENTIEQKSKGKKLHSNLNYEMSRVTRKAVFRVSYHV